ncbi:porin [Roseobacter sp. HKCCA0434]|uniref:porin n=1 Tax=Roseobacter sp. HKCCA0434 TaxID=3079297 RepID=UPI002905F1E1|nr:porin [Roseobacter sp. HKCCA0434]
MKNVLFASTALVAFGFAGTAFAQVSTSITLSGSAELGFTSVDDGGAQDGEIQLHNDFDLTWALTGVTDGGMAFGASGDWDEANVEEDTSAFISGSFGTITIGDTDGAYDKAMIEIATGGLVDEADFYANGYSGLDGTGDAESQVGRYDITFGGVTLSASYEDGEDDGQENVYGIGAGFNFGGFDFGVGYQTSDGAALAVGDTIGIAEVPVAVAGTIDDAQVYGITMGASFGAVDFNIGYERAEADLETAGLVAGSAAGDDFEQDSLQASVQFDIGAGSLGINYHTAETDVDGGGEFDVDGYGIFYSMDLGGGANFVAAAGNLEVDGAADETRFGAGIGMSF